MNLSQVYDEILSDSDLTKEIFEFYRQDLVSPILECACGSGDFLITMQVHGFDATGLDLDKEMLELAHQKGAQNLVLGNMLDLNELGQFNTILCLGDSLNYLTEKREITQFFKEVYNHLNDKGLFIFDMHDMSRLVEFMDPFIEEAEMNNYQYQWVIQTDNDHLIHQFVFFKEHDTIRQIITQRVYPKNFINDILEEIGFKIFSQNIDENGEKIITYCKKED